MSKPKILLLDIETKPMLSWFWRLFDEQGGTAMLKEDSNIISWSAKWLDKPEIMYMDQRNAKDIEDEKKLLQGIWKLLDECDVVIGHNSDRFDLKRLNARFIKYKMKPPSSYKKIDTLKIAKKFFDFASNKLEFLAKFLGCENKKLTKRKFAGFELWKECMKGNKEAWKEMEKYNKQDVIVLQEVYKRLEPWDKSIDFNVYSDDEEHVCSCGSTSRKKNGWDYTKHLKYQRYACTNCGKESRDRKAFKREE
jgi:DNA polymerase III epsilon subunit-like protein